MYILHLALKMRNPIMDIIFWTRICLIIQSYWPGGTNSTRMCESCWNVWQYC